MGNKATRLTADKEAGATVQIGADTVALGIPRAQQKGPAGFPLVPLRRAATAAEAAMSVLALASPLCSYVSGHTLEVRSTLPSLILSVPLSHELVGQVTGGMGI